MLEVPSKRNIFDVLEKHFSKKDENSRVSASGFLGMQNFEPLKDEELESHPLFQKLVSYPVLVAFDDDDNQLCETNLFELALRLFLRISDQLQQSSPLLEKMLRYRDKNSADAQFNAAALRTLIVTPNTATTMKRCDERI